jgi:hypothetical protein
MGLYFGNALTLVLYPARNGPLNFACVIWGASCKTNVSNFTNLTTGSFHLVRFHKFEKFIMLGKQSWSLGILILDFGASPRPIIHEDPQRDFFPYT